MLNIAWIVATVAGYLLGAIIGKPEQWGLDFAFIATFLALLVGMWLISKVTPSPRVAAWLRHIPGAVLVAIVAPAVFTQGCAEASASLATVLVAKRTKNVLLAMVVGIGVVWGLRHFFP